MQTKTIMIGALALVFGISAALGAYMLVRNPAGTAQMETVSVYLAAVDVSRGQTLVAEHLMQREWPKDAVPEGAITDAEAVLDRTATVALMKGDLLSDAKLAPLGAGRGMAAVIPTGMRAVTIQTPNVATGVAGFILPGNKVDVLMTVSSSGQDDPTGGGSSITLLQNVEILAVDQRIDAPQDNKMDLKELRSVTLLVNPPDAARLDLGQNKGVLHLALRNHADVEMAVVEPATLAGLKFGSGAPVVVGPVVVAPPTAEASEKSPKATVIEPIVAAPVPRRPMLIRTLRGSTHGYVSFPAPAAKAEALAATPAPPAEGDPLNSTP